MREESEPPKEELALELASPNTMTTRIAASPIRGVNWRRGLGCGLGDLDVAECWYTLDMIQRVAYSQTKED
jgi:hypothetical protein